MPKGEKTLIRRRGCARTVQSAVRCVLQGLPSRHCQLAPWVLGVLMRASLPRCSQSASGMIAMSDTLARQAQIMDSVRSSDLQRR